MVECRDIRRAVWRDEPIAPELREHLERCESCREVAEHGGALGRALIEPDQGPVGPEDVDAMFAELQQRVSRERGAAAWLRARPTPVRVGLGAMVALASAAGLGLLLPGRDLSALGSARAAGALAIWAVVTVWAIALGLRPLHRAGPPTRATALLVALALGTPVLLALWPSLPPAAAAAEQAVGLAVKCLGLGALAGLPVMLVLRAVDRSPGGLSLLLAAAASGLAGAAGLELGCPHRHALHLLLGHATVAAAYVGAAAASVAVADRRTG